ncbi:MAG: hypothetical protein IPH05_11835 [Flavobacteriales bacterium]|jgi:hypothetical protein|nr:hypothetical protein [Flavobacteriales bacterium]MBK6549701.1 hypothetical protein [Flavobacteriales bacterium]MBK6883613.1 hypothetical protein [Flavobacteriales bacterium]MBK7102217.1 hypothetical protein [Flavobacteriales bacterium]MBK7112956.1 hypothetical protein [Flavobacteriales bacterium]
MTLTRRLQLYTVGLIIGGLMVYFIYGDRATNAAWTPESKLKQRLHSTLVQARPLATEQLAEHQLKLEEVQAAIPGASVDFSDSRRTPDTIYYAVDATVAHAAYRFTIVGLRDFDRDSTATLWAVERR